LSLRGIATVSLVAIFFLVSDLFQRALVCPAARMLSGHGPAVHGRWQRFMSRTLFMILKRCGGADIPRPGRVPGGPGILILMNHQSLLDIPMAIASGEGVFSRIVTRQRYARWIPVISHTIRTLDYPVVNPRAKAGTGRRLLEQLDQVARTSVAPLIVFPEGTRSIDGEIGRFRTAGLGRILGAREWIVYVLVGDGYWRHGKLVHLLGGMQKIKGRLSVLGPIEWSDPAVDPADFIARMRNLMVDELARVREGGTDLVPGPGPAQIPDLAPVVQEATLSNQGKEFLETRSLAPAHIRVFGDP
jgi:1-acyl-sn-glycerol-3-phosphate acyltransferase